MTMWRRLAMLVLLAGSTGVLFADVAHAHTDTDVVAVPAGSTATVTFRPQHGCEGSPTITVAVRAPVPGAVAEEVEGWSASSTPEGDGFTVLEWVGGVLPADEAGAFPVEFVVPDAVGELLVFPAVQGCENGGELPWISGDPAAEFPAPRVLDPGRRLRTGRNDRRRPSGCTGSRSVDVDRRRRQPERDDDGRAGRDDHARNRAAGDRTGRDRTDQRSGDHRNVGRDRHDRSGNGRHRIDRYGTDVRRRWRQRRRRVGRAVDPRWPRWSSRSPSPRSSPHAAAHGPTRPRPATRPHPNPDEPSIRALRARSDQIM